MRQLARCQCEVPCKNTATAEDLLCNMCRDPDWSCIPTNGGRLTSTGTDRGADLTFGPGHMWIRFSAVTE